MSYFDVETGEYRGPSVCYDNLDVFYNYRTSLGDLKEVYGRLDMSYTFAKSLGKVEKVDGDLDLTGVSFKDTGQVKEVTGCLDICESSIESLTNVETLGRLKMSVSTRLKTFSNVKNIGELWVLDGNTVVLILDTDSKVRDVLKEIEDFESLPLSEYPMYMNHENIIIRNRVKLCLETGK
jgi:hypothetical protein